MAKIETLYASSGGAQESVGIEGSALYGPSYNKVGAEFIRVNGQVAAMNTNYNQGYFQRVEHAPWMNGVTVLSMQLMIDAGQGYSSDGSNPREGTVSVCAAGSEYNVSMGYEYLFNQMKVAQEFATCPTGELTVISVTDNALKESILRYGVVLKMKSSNMYAEAKLLAVTYEYMDENESPEVTITAAPSVVYMADDIVLSWRYSQSANLAQTAVDVDLCTAEGASLSRLADKVSGNAKSITVNLRSVKTKLQAGEGWMLRVRAYAKNNALVSAWADAPLALKNIEPAIISPKNGENRMAASVVSLQWKKADGDTSVGAPYGFTVQYSETAGETWTDLLVKGTTKSGDSGWYLDVPANTFRHGSVQWRVLVWDTEYQYGSFARETFNAVVQASTSSVQCDGKPLPTISWTSASQVAYQVRFADYDSGAIYGTAHSHRVPYVYEDGLYQAQVRTQAETGAWSAWTPEKYVSVTNTPPTVEQFRLVAKKTAHAVTLTWDVLDAFAAYILYRDNVPIHVGTSRQYTDVYGNGSVAYFVRGITAAGNYLQSINAVLDVTPDVDCLYDIASDRWIPLKFSSEPRKRQYMTSQRLSLRYYSGRRNPVAFTEGFYEHSGTFSCCTKNPAEAQEIERLAGAEVICKGRDGESIRGILNSVTRVSGQVQEVSFSVTETDWEEKVKYETA